MLKSGEKIVMLGIFLAWLAAFTYSLGVVLTRKKMIESNYFSATMTVTIVGIIIIWPLTLLSTNFKTINIQGILLFVMAGIFAPGITRLLYNKGMEILGASICASIFSINPMFSSILAFLLLNEIITLENWIGIICIIAGVIFIERIFTNSKNESKKFSKKGLFFPLLGALTSGASFLIRKIGLNIYNEPLLGVAIGYSLSFLLYFLLSTSSNAHYMPLIEDIRLFWKPGIFLSLGWIFSFYALSYEKVSVVTSINQTGPLFILFFSYLYLKEIESISLKVIFGTIIIVIGAILVSI